MESNEELIILTNGAGGFDESLKRSNVKIREDRATQITKDGERFYRRMVEDKIVELDNAIRDRDNALDLSPTDANSLILASSFKADQFAKNDHTLTLLIRSLAIEVQVGRARYKQLFKKDL